MADLTEQEKRSYILKNESMITTAVLNGHMPHDEDEYKECRRKIKQYRTEIYGDNIHKYFEDLARKNKKK